MILEKTLKNLKKSKDSFFNLSDCYLDYDLFKNGIFTCLVHRYSEQLYFLNKKHFLHHLSLYQDTIPKTIKFYLLRGVFYHIPINLKKYFNDSSNFFLLKLKNKNKQIQEIL